MRAVAWIGIAYKRFQSSRSISTIVQRSTQYASLTPVDVDAFRSIVGPTGVISDAHDLERYNTDWLRKYTGKSRCAIRPRSTEQVAEVLAYCNKHRLAVVPQGGNTGLVGGSVPVHDEIVLSLSLMNKVLSFDEASGVVCCEAGCVLAAVEEHVSAHGFTMPLDLGAKGSCQLGGNVSTNAGGIRLLRYGSLRGSVLGLQAVLANGTVLDLMRALRKDNTGYDLKQLFIGAEGTLGVVTQVAVLCPPKPLSVQVAFAAVRSYPDVLQVLQRARRNLGEILSAYEFLDSDSVRVVEDQLPGLRSPLSQKYPFYVLVETSGSDERHDSEKLNGFLEGLMEEGVLLDGVVAQDVGQANTIWKVRESVTEALTRRGAVYKYDVSIPVGGMYDLVEDMRSRFADNSDVIVTGYGHVGDGNLHLNVSCPGSYQEAILSRIEPYVYEWVTQRRGSVSAEHGLGYMKAECIGYSKGEEAIEVMRGVKEMLDPNQILNPYKVLPARGLSGVKA